MRPVTETLRDMLQRGSSLRAAANTDNHSAGEQTGGSGGFRSSYWRACPGGQECLRLAGRQDTSRQTHRGGRVRKPQS